MAPTNTRVILRTEYAIRYAPAPSRTAEEELTMVDAAMRQQGVERTLEIMQRLIASADPSTLFIPTVWEDEKLKAHLLEEALRNPPPPLPTNLDILGPQDEIEEQEVEPEYDDEPDVDEDGNPF